MDRQMTLAEMNDEFGAATSLSGVLPDSGVIYIYRGNYNSHRPIQY